MPEAIHTNCIIHMHVCNEFNEYDASSYACGCVASLVSTYADRRLREKPIVSQSKG